MSYLVLLALLLSGCSGSIIMRDPDGLEVDRGGYVFLTSPVFAGIPARGVGQRRRSSAPSDSMTSKLKVTIDVGSVDITRAMTVLRRLHCDDVALTDDVRIQDRGRDRPSTFVLHLSPETESEEATFIKDAAASPEQEQWLRFLYAHSREGRNVFMTSDVETFGAEGGERRQRLEDAAGTQIMTLAEFERLYVAGRA
jgi:hypothetical protein